MSRCFHASLPFNRRHAVIHNAPRRVMRILRNVNRAVGFNNPFAGAAIIMPTVRGEYQISGIAPGTLLLIVTTDLRAKEAAAIHHCRIDTLPLE